MHTLYYYPGNASLAPHIVLEELGIAYRLELVDRRINEHKSAAYLALNPAGVIPTLTVGTQVICEAAAICLYLADTQPATGLLPPVGSPARGQHYRWLFYLSNTLQAELMHWFYPERLGGEDCVPMLKANAEQRVGTMLDLLEQQLAQTNGQGLLTTMSVADAYLFMLGRWTRAMPHPARARLHFFTFLNKMASRPAVQHAMAQEGLERPWF